MLKRIFRGLVVLLLIVAIGAGLWLYFIPPDLLRVGSGYAAKIVCSNVFIANRDPDEVLAEDVQAPGHPLLHLMRITVDREEKRVDAALLGSIAPSEAIYREGTGCTVVPVGTVVAGSDATKAEALAEADGVWPAGDKIESDESLAALLSDVALTGPGMRAVVIVKDGKISAETYGDGFSKDIPLLGWSMTKTVNTAIIGRLMMENRISADEKNLFPQWRSDGRADIRIADLLAMESGLGFNENYGAVADVTRMLFLEPDMAGFVEAVPLEADIGSRFNYSSGTAVLLSRIWMDRIGNASDALGYPWRSLFNPLGMTSAVMETDAAGTFVGSSYMYATARDWARFGLFLAHDGVWNGERLLPQGFVEAMHAPNRSSGGRYSKMQTWLPKPEAGLPSDAFVISGHDGQTIFVIPSLDLVIVRLGLTPRSQGYDAAMLVSEVVKRVRAD
ncbi:serine hydrolase domain-containing protein [Aliirhizobium smilacinae]|uniref:serine hydrolase domain-containing protein n=1 Tax=Aliirhizobium smilacinae TaxID=1395944 RepID=UPI001FE88905|nr:serine hydrolase [Rhizobium smilacinae]